ncbi:PNGase F N-terminal domain-containing protein [Aureibacter tunicatorum]|uniref:Peptide-N-glycosidase F N-terminal domain-containing protein n=1 Tax=Aureibacter tunicatorum TaxID=866807 RepID=A0AAE3XMR5_9BACT|nr:PNGase F N-terminal domain-containing protein [Aureibacter tunicatorum]MDR6238621.1 hypothetical protein [Aureibacter tunicatorum]
MKRVLYAFIAGLIFYSCSNHKELPANGDQVIKVFDHENIHFEPNKYAVPSKPNAKGVMHLDNGRVIMKKIRIDEEYERSVNITAKVTVTSNGDAWDKSGSAFIIPAESEINLLDILNKNQQFPEPTNLEEKFYGIKQEAGYKPNLEIMRFMTPFGVGYYSDSMENRRPVYVPHWEKEVVWTQDISDFADRLTAGEYYVGAWIDTWTKEGYNLSMDINIEESELACDKRTQKWVEPVLNTVVYTGPQKAYDAFSRGDLSFEIDIPKHVKNVQLKYLVTGHGGHSGGDEFVKNQNIVSLDGQTILDFYPWRDDCASFRRFNPHSGVWTEKAEWKGKEIDERIASSDYSRSNWCPGSVVDPEVIDLSSVTAGKHVITISIPNAQPTKKNEMNHWLVSAYLVGENIK